MAGVTFKPSLGRFSGDPLFHGDTFVCVTWRVMLRLADASRVVRC